MQAEAPKNSTLMKISTRYVHRRLWSVHFNSAALTIAAGEQTGHWRVFAGLDLGLGRSTSGLKAWSMKLVTSGEVFSGRLHGGLRLDAGPLILIPVTPKGDTLISIGASLQLFAGIDLWTTGQRALFLDAQAGLDFYPGINSVLVRTYAGALGYRF